MLQARSILGTIKYDTVVKTGRTPCKVCNPTAQDVFRPLPPQQKIARLKKKKLSAVSTDGVKAIKRQRRAFHHQYEPQEVRTVTVVSGQTATVTFNNILKRGSLQVTKTSEDGLVEGIQFKLSGTSLAGLPVEQYAITDKNGVATFEDDRCGEYSNFEEGDRSVGR